MSNSAHEGSTYLDNSLQENDLKTISAKMTFLTSNCGIRAYSLTSSTGGAATGAAAAKTFPLFLVDFFLIVSFVRKGASTNLTAVQQIVTR